MMGIRKRFGVLSNVFLALSVGVLLQACGETGKKKQEHVNGAGPHAAGDIIKVVEDTRTELDLLGNDRLIAPGSIIHVLVEPKLGKVEELGTALVYTPATNSTEADTFTYEVEYNGNTYSAVVTLEITPVNDLPDTENDLAATEQGDSIVFNVLDNDTDVEADELTIGDADQQSTGGGTVKCHETGICEYTPDPAFSGPDTFTYRASDGEAAVEGVVSINVHKGNSKPKATGVYGGKLNVVEDRTANSFLVSEDEDEDQIFYEIVAYPQHGALTVTGDTGQFVYNPDVNFFGTDYFWYRAFDGFAYSATQAVQVVVASVNDVPTASGRVLHTPEAHNIASSMLFQDVDDSAVTFTVVDSVDVGVLTVTASTGAFFYRPPVAFHGLVQFTFEVFDGDATSPNTATISIFVDKVNDAPVVENQTVMVNEDGVASFSLFGYDPDGDALYFEIITMPSNGLLNAIPNSVSFNYSPTANFNGGDLFAWRISDGEAYSAVAIVNINVASVNDAPTSGGGPAAVNEDQTFSAVVGGSDVDGDALTWEIVSAPLHGTASFDSTGRLTYTPTANYNGTDVVVFRVKDSQNATSPNYTVNFTVNAVNDTPLAVGGVATVNEEGTVEINLSGSDPDGDSITFALVGSPTNGWTSMFDAQAGVVSYTGNANFFGTDTVRFRVSDGARTSAIQTITITVVNVDDAPQTSSPWVNALEDEVVTMALYCLEVDGEPLTFQIVAQPNFGVASVDAVGVLTYTPNANFNGADYVSYTCSDGNSQSGVGVVSLSLQNVNDPPILNAGSYTTVEDVQGAMPLSIVDVDGDVNVVEIVAQGTHGTASSVFTTAYYTPDPDWFGTDQVAVRVGDGVSWSSIAILTITVTPVNDPPSIVAPIGVIHVTEDTLYSGQIVVADVDDASGHIFTIPQMPQGTLVLNSSTGAFTFQPPANGTGFNSFLMQVVDSSGASSGLQSIEILTELVNDVPYAEELTVIVQEDGFVVGTVLAHDVEGEPLSFQLVTSPTKGALVMNASGTFQYDALPNTSGWDLAWFRVKDTQNAWSAYQRLNIRVDEVNDAPVLTVADQSMNEDGIKTFNLVGSDPDGDSLTYLISGAPAHGSASIAGNTVTYLPAANYNGTDAIQVYAQDGRGGITAVQTVTISIVPVNDLPVMSSITIVGDEDTNINWAFTASDLDGDTLTYTIESAAAHGTVTLLGNGNFRYRGAANWFGADEFTVKAHDAAGASNLAIISVNVIPVNDAPTAGVLAASGSEDSALVVDFSSVFTDLDGDDVFFILDGSVSNGSLTVDQGANSFTFTPAANWSGISTVYFRGSDGDLTSGLGSVTITIAPVNDAPVLTGQSVSGQEDVTLFGTVAGLDVDGNTLTYEVVAGFDGDHGTVSLNGATGFWSFVPDANYAGNDSFRVRAFDGVAYSLSAVVTLSFSGVNDAPVVYPVFVTGLEDTLIGGVFVGTDIDSADIDYDVVAMPNVGLLTFNAGVGTFSYSPAANDTGVRSFTYRGTDGDKLSAIQEVQITVQPVNDAPTAVATSMSLSEDGVACVNLAAMASDIEGDSLVFSLAGAGHSSAGISLSGTDLCVSPDDNWFGSTVEQYRVCETASPTVCSAWRNISISVGSVNDAPMGNDVILATLLEDAPQACESLTSAVSDVDVGDNHIYYLSGSVAFGTSSLDQLSGLVCVTPHANQEGSGDLQYRVCDTGSPVLCSSVQNLSVIVQGVNDAPTSQNYFATILEDATLELDLDASDVENDMLMFNAVTDPISGVSYPEHGAVIVGPTGNLTYIPDYNYYGTDTVVFEACETVGGLCSGLHTVLVTIVSQNDAPTMNVLSISTNEDSPAIVNVTGNDPEGGVLTVQITYDALYGSVGVVGPMQLEFVPDANRNGQDYVGVRVCDDAAVQACSPVQNVSITVSSVNDAPIVTPFGTLNLSEDGSYSGRVLATDIDVPGQSLTYAVVAGAQHGIFSAQLDGNFVYTPNANYYGSDRVYVKANDGYADSVSQIVNFAVASVNDAPVVSAHSFSTAEDTNLITTVTSSDVDNAIQSYVIDNAPLHGIAFFALGGQLTYIPTGDYVGTDSLNYHAVDVDLLDSTVKTINLTVTPVNDTPVWLASGASITLTTDEDVQGCVNWRSHVTDVDAGDVITATTTSSVHITAAVLGANVCVTGGANWFGNENISVQAFDAAGVSAGSRVIPVTVSPVNDAPIVTAQFKRLKFMAAAVATTWDVSAEFSDVDGDTLYFSIVTDIGAVGASKGFASVLVTGVTYTPIPSTSGLDGLTLEVCDQGVGLGACLERVVLVVNPKTSFTTFEDVANTDLLLDPPPGLPTGWTAVNAVSPATHGDITVLNGDEGVVFVVPQADYPFSATLAGQMDYQYEVCDAAQLSNCSGPISYAVLVQAIPDSLGGSGATFTMNEVETTALLHYQADLNDGVYNPDGLGLAFFVISTAQSNNPTLIYNDAVSAPAPSPLSYLYNIGLNRNQPLGHNTYGQAVMQYQACEIAIPTNCTGLLTGVIRVWSTEDAPILVSGTTALSMTEDITAAINLQAVDYDGDVTTTVVLSPPNAAKGSVAITAATGYGMWHASAKNANGSTNMTVKITDSQGLSNTYVKPINIAAVNDAPVLVGYRNDSASASPWAVILPPAANTAPYKSGASTLTGGACVAPNANQLRTDDTGGTPDAYGMSLFFRDVEGNDIAVDDLVAPTVHPYFNNDVDAPLSTLYGFTPNTNAKLSARRGPQNANMANGAVGALPDGSNLDIVRVYGTPSVSGPGAGNVVACVPGVSYLFTKTITVCDGGTPSACTTISITIEP